MTAVIGLMNKTGIALAADSAVTVTGNNQKKIYNTANKIFTLSKYHPVGIMIFSSASFMSIPWETIIKLYRKNIGENSFDFLVDYKNDFLKFLKDQNYYTSLESQEFELGKFIYWNLNLLKNEALKNIPDATPADQQDILFFNYIEETLNTNIQALIDSNIITDDFANYTLEQFTAFADKELRKLVKMIFEERVVSEQIISLLINQFYLHIKSDTFLFASTGLVFAGFGDKEIYPSVTSIQIAEAFDNHLRYFEIKTRSVSDTNDGQILPFAQTDVIDMFLTGVSPDIDYAYMNIYQKFIEKYNTILTDILDKDSPDLAQEIRDINIEELVSNFRDEMNDIKREKQINPTIDTISILSKEDLAEMAESLVYLTYLKRRISSDDESVGGPIDVAIISKGDGFIWKKRKHYFQEELNKHFMRNYFK